MSLLLGVCGCAALVVVFGLVGGGHEKTETDHDCGSCGCDDHNADCGSCQTVRETLE